MRYLIALFLLLSANANALDLTQKTVIEGQILRGQFKEEKVLQGFSAPMKSNGHFTIAPGHGLIWAVDKPFAVTTVIKPSGLKQKVNGNKTMEIPSDKVPFLVRLYNMLGGTLSGDWTALEADFIVTKSGTQDKWKVVLEPRQKNNPAMPFSLITVTGSNFVDNVVMQKLGGDKDTITFFNQKVITETPNSQEKADLD